MSVRKSSVLIIPVLILVALLAGILISTYISLQQEKAAFIEELSHQIKVAGSRLSRLSEILLDRNPGLLEEEVMFTSLELNGAIVLVADSGDQVLFAQDSSWRNIETTRLLDPAVLPLLENDAQAQRYNLILNDDRAIFSHHFDLFDPQLSNETLALGRILIIRDFSTELWGIYVAKAISQWPVVALLLTIALGLSFWLHRRVVTPIKQLAAVSHLIGTKTEYHLPESLFGELDDLANALTTMAQRLSRQQNELRDSLAFSSAVFEQAPDAIELVDGQTLRILDANATSCRLLGYSREERINQKITDFQAELSAADLQQLVDRILVEGNVSLTTQHRHRDGHLIDVQVELTVLRQQTGIYLIAIWRDITAEKRSKEQLRKLSLAVEQSPNPVVITDLKPSIEYVNEAFVQVTGHSREEVYGRNPRILQSGKTPQKTYQQLWQYLTAGRPWRGEFINHTRSGEEQIEEALIIPLRDDEDRVSHYVALKQNITERKRREAELNKLYLAVEQSPESIVITNLNAEIEYVNPAFETSTGYSRDEVLGKNPSLLQSGSTDPQLYSEMWQILKQGKVWRGKFNNRRKDGTEYIELVSISPVRQDDGQITHYLAVQEDVTKKEQMQSELAAYRDHLEELVESRTAELTRLAETLQNNNEEQEAIFDTATAGIAFIKDRRIMRVNRSMELLFGYEPGEMLNKTTEAWYDDASTFQEVGEVITNALQSGQVFHMDRRLRRKDGSHFVARMAARALDPEDLSKGLVGMLTDITSELAALEKLKESLGRQQAIFNTASSGIALTKERIILSCNRRIEEIFGWPDGTMAGQSTAVWYADEEGFSLGGEPYEAIWRGETHTRDQQLARKDGSLFWARLSGTAVDAQDPDKGVVWVIDDITREREVTEQMAQAREMAEAATRMKSDFLANMSHEIRTPMNAIIGMTHLAMKTDLNKRQQDYLRKIQFSSKHLLNIINDILDLSKIEAGKMKFEMVEFQVDQMIRNVTDLIAERAAAKGLELVIWVDGEMPRFLVGDPLRLGQILINFATNAVKFTEQGDITLRASLLRRSSKMALVRFEVVDTGIGISPEDAARLFEKFEQAESGTTRKYGGTGLGLSISKQLTELMGGKVGVESTPGEGSSFWIEVPFKLGKQQAPELLPNLDLRGCRILVVEDHKSSREAIVEMLQSMTFEVGAAASATEALQQLRQGFSDSAPYELLLIDWRLPETDGIALAKAVQQEFGDKAPPMALITAYDREELIELATDVGISEILVKPVGPSELFDMAAILLRGIDREVPQVADKAVSDFDLNQIRGARILLVEDNEVNREVATELLGQAGFITEVAENGAIAVEKVRQKGPVYYDLILMDMQMPVMDGVTATREILKNPDNSDLPIIAMTANVMDSDISACMAAGMRGHVAKPVEPDELWKALVAWITPGERNAEPRQAGPRQAGPRQTEPSQTEPSQAAAASSDALAEGLYRIPGIDIDLALRRTLGQPRILLSVLEKFVSNQQHSGVQLTKALSSDDRVTAERLAHTLKSSAALIGAIELSTQAQQLEADIRAGKDAQRLLTDAQQLDAQLTRLVDQIRPQLPAHTSSSGRTTGQLEAEQAEEFTRICDQLAEMLGDYAYASDKMMLENEALLRPALGSYFDAIEDQVREFNFEQALLLLNEAREQLSA